MLFLNTLCLLYNNLVSICYLKQELYISQFTLYKSPIIYLQRKYFYWG